MNLSKLIEQREKLTENLSEVWNELLLALAGSLKSNRDLIETEEIRDTLEKTFELPNFIEEFESLSGRLNKEFPEILSALREIFFKLTYQYYNREREKIEFYRQTLSELATPILDISDRVLLVPLIGHIDSERAQTMAENLLLEVEDKGVEKVVLDVTGLPMIDTAVADHLLTTIAALKLMGVEVILCGIQPSIAKTLVKLNIDFSSIEITRSLYEALKKVVRTAK